MEEFQQAYDLFLKNIKGWQWWPVLMPVLGILSALSLLIINITRHSDESDRIHEVWKSSQPSSDVMTQVLVWCTITSTVLLIFMLEITACILSPRTLREWVIEHLPLYLLLLIGVVGIFAENPVFFMDGDPHRLLFTYWAISQTRTDVVIGIISILLASSDRLYYGLGAPSCWLLLMHHRGKLGGWLGVSLGSIVCVTRFLLFFFDVSRVTQCGVMIQNPMEAMILSVCCALGWTYGIYWLIYQKRDKAEGVVDDEEGDDEEGPLLELNWRGRRARQRPFFKVEGAK